MWAKTGSMVAYQGDVRFQNKGSGGLNKMLKKAVTGEGVDMMECTGQGELFVANLASEIQIFYLENDMVSVNGNNVLAFSSSIDWDIHRLQARGGMMAGGMKSMVRGGTGELVQMASTARATYWCSPPRASSRAATRPARRSRAGCSATC